MAQASSVDVSNQIQRDIFQQNTERVRYLIRVSRPNKKKGKVSYLVLAVNDVKNTHYIVIARRNDDAKNFHLKFTWRFEEITYINSNPDPDNLLEFEIALINKQIFKWHAYSTKDIVMFIQLVKQIKEKSSVYDDLRIVNFHGEENDNGHLNGNGSFDDGSIDRNEEWNPHEDAYQALTSREESDLERLIEFESTINNAEAFTEKLCRELSTMDTLNIQDIMASEDRVLALIETINSAIEETSNLEMKIIQYESCLKNVRDIVQKVEKKEAVMQTLKENNDRLLCEVGELVENLDFKPMDEDALSNGNLDSLPDIARCLEASHRLQAALNYQPSANLSQMTAYRQQKEYLDGVRMHFAFKLLEHLRKKIQRMAKDYQSQPKTNEMVLTEHLSIHQELGHYSGLMRWLRQMEHRQYEVLKSAYMEHFSGIYDEEFRKFFEFLKERHVHSTKSSNSGTNRDPANRDSLAPSPSFRRRTLNDSRRGSVTPSGVTGHSDTIDTVSTRSSEMSLSEWEEFDAHIDFMLKTIDPVCATEQRFCEKFFDLSEKGIDSVTSTPVSGRESSKIHSETMSISNQSQSIVSSEQNTNNKQQLMARLCQSFESEFIQFVDFYDKLDGIYSLYFLVRLSQYVLGVRDKTSFLAKGYGNILIHVKRHFDNYMRQMESEISEAKDPRRTKVGVLHFIKRFEHFAKQTEHVLKYGGPSTRRTDIDKWYITLMERIFVSITRIAKEHQKNYKTPSQMIELENYHYIQNMLFMMKISCLDAERKDSKNRYNAALRDYVSLYFGRPLEKLNEFFEGVQAKVAQGVREEEIGYQLTFSKQELRKIIKDINLKDIKKGLEEMYKKVEKHASDLNSTLIQVIWRSMQEEFITQYKHCCNMIDRCYPGANISLMFTIEDVLNVFSDIAQQH